MDTLPNFFIIGAAKAATSSLSSFIDSHPQGAIVRGKEPHFFSYDDNYKSGWEKYLTLYRHCAGATAIGDASTSYSRIRYHSAVIRRIHQHVPNAKIIYMVRHPLQRIESAYVEHACTPGGESPTSINDAVKGQPMIIDSSRYWEVFDAYRQQFPESRIKIVWFEEYVANTIEVYRDVCRFLGIDDSVIPEFDLERANSRYEASQRFKALRGPSRMLDTNWNKDVRRYVIDQLREDNCRFLTYFGRPLSYWDNLFQ